MRHLLVLEGDDGADLRRTVPHLVRQPVANVELDAVRELALEVLQLLRAVLWRRSEMHVQS
jgi:hypothetical protein